MEQRNTDTRMALKITEVSQMLGIDRRLVMKLIAQRKLKATRAGKTILVSRKSVERFIDGEE